MNKSIRWAFVMCLGLLIAVPAVASEAPGDPPSTYLEAQAKTKHRVVHFARVIDKGDRPPIPLPVPVEPETTHGALGGMSDSEGAKGVGGMGVALLSPRGGAVSNPRQKADREIRRLIRRLD